MSGRRDEAPRRAWLSWLTLGLALGALGIGLFYQATRLDALDARVAALDRHLRLTAGVDGAMPAAGGEAGADPGLGDAPLAADVQQRLARLERRVAAAERAGGALGVPGGRPASPGGVESAAAAGAAGRAEDARRPAGPMPAGAHSRAQRRDLERYGEEELARIEDLYRRGNEDPDSDESRRALKTLADDYLDSNRGGCAAMNLGARLRADGDTDGATRYFEKIIAANSGATFANGDPVLPKALYSLGLIQAERGDSDLADETFKRLVSEFGDVVEPGGETYAELVGRVP